MRIGFQVLYLCMTNLLVYISYGMPASFLPQFGIQQKGVTQMEIGIIFGIFPVGSIFISTIFGKYMHFWGKKRLVQFSLLILAISLGLFASLYWVQTRIMFDIVSITAGVLTGVGVGGYSSIADAYMPILYPEKANEMIGYMQLSIGSGLALGPTIGGFMYLLGGFQFTFFFWMIFWLITFTFISNLFPKDAEVHPHEEPLQLTKFLRNPDYFFVTLLFISASSGFVYVVPTLADYLSTAFHMPPWQCGLVFFCVNGAYGFGVLLTRFLPKKIRKGIWIAVGTLLSSFGLLICGPAPQLRDMFGLQKSEYITMGGLLLIGFGSIGPFNQIMQDLTDISKGNSIFPGIYKNVRRVRLCDMSSGIFNVAIGISQITGAFGGSTFAYYYGFPQSSAVLSYFQWTCIVLYLITGGYRQFCSYYSKNEINPDFNEPEKQQQNMECQPLRNQNLTVSNGEGEESGLKQKLITQY